MKAIQRLKKRQEELDWLLILNSGGSYGSQRKEFLKQQKKHCEDLIRSYQQNSPFPSLEKAQEELNQQIGFEQIKKFILEEIEIQHFFLSRPQPVKRKFPIFTLVGPAGIGKTTFAKILAQALGKPFFILPLGGEKKSATFLGTNPESPRSELGKIAQFLIQGQVADPLILLDEIDKSYLPEILSSLLDPEQNSQIFEQCLGVDLDFSQIYWVATANELEKIPFYLRSRLTIIEFKEYDFEEKKAIAELIRKNWLTEMGLSSDLLTFTAEAWSTLISKTQEKGVRQLKVALESIIGRFCLKKWSEEKNLDQPLKKIEITENLVHQLIPFSFSPVESKEAKKDFSSEKEDKNWEKEIQAFRQELKKLATKQQEWEKNQSITKKQTDKEKEREGLKASKLQALVLIRKALNQCSEKEEIILGKRNCQKEINKCSSCEQVKIVQGEILLQIAEKSKKKIPISELNKINLNLNELLLKNENNLEKLWKIAKADRQDVQILKNELQKTEQKTKELEKKLRQNRHLSLQIPNSSIRSSWQPATSASGKKNENNSWFFKLVTVGLLALVSLIGLYLVRQVQKRQKTKNQYKSGKKSYL